ncbi:MAG: hypothetical protein JXB29_06425 [Sedimentisphaerales bacterium]|nr:hypothetical protein [Sedimentisphaerales bacterium]
MRISIDGGRIDVDYVTNNGESNYADVGAYESLMVWFVDKDATGFVKVQ